MPGYRALVEDSIVYGVGGGLGRAASILVTPILARVLAPADYGVIDAIVASTTLLPCFMSLNLESALLRYHYETEDRASRRELTSTVVLFVVSLSVVIAGACTFWSRQLGLMLLATSAYTNELVVSVWGVGCQLLGAVFVLLLRLDRRRKAFVGLSVATALLNVVFTVVLVVVHRKGVIGFVVASLGASLALALAGAWLVRGHLSLGMSARRLVRCLRFSMPIVPVNLISAVFLWLPRTLILSNGTLADVGLFGLASKVTNAVLFLVGSFLLAWQPFAMAVMRRPDSKIVYATVSRYVALGLGAVTLPVVFFAPEITRLVGGPAFAPAWRLLPLLAAATMVGQFVFIFNTAALVAERPVLFMYSSLVGLGTFLLLGGVLTSHLGAFGTSAALLLSALFQSGSMYVLAQRVSRVDYPLPGILFLVAAIVVGGLGLVELPLTALHRLVAAVAIALVAFRLLIDMAEARAMVSSVRAWAVARSW